MQRAGQCHAVGGSSPWLPGFLWDSATDRGGSRHRELPGGGLECYVSPVLKPIFEVAKELAEAHRAEDPETTSVFLADSPTEVRLIEVSGSVGTSGEVLPFRFAPRPDLGVPYASVVVLLSEDDWGRITRGELELPPGWGTPSALKKIA